MNCRAVIRRRTRGATGALLVGCVIVLAGAVSPSLAATPDQAPPVAPGQARVWFLRQMNPGSAMNAPMISANGAPLAISSEGTAFYRDFAPGSYVFSVANCSPDSQTSMTLPLTPGDQIALQVQANDFGPLDCGPTFYLSAPAPDMLSSVFAPLSYLGQN
jgi:hypothetical protein